MEVLSEEIVHFDQLRYWQKNNVKKVADLLLLNC